MVITDCTARFTSVRDSQSRYRKEEFFDIEGNKGLKWSGEVINNLNNRIDITVVVEKRKIPEGYEAVVIGSGFGGRICVLERSQWWISNEIPDKPNETTDNSQTLRGYLIKNDMPYSTWAYPDDTKDSSLSLEILSLLTA